jgi:hypothetical protein
MATGKHEEKSREPNEVRGAEGVDRYRRRYGTG